MTKTTRYHPIADIEPTIALANAFAVERERSIQPSIAPSQPLSRSYHHDAKIARALYVRELLGRLAMSLLPWGRAASSVEATHRSRDSFRSA